MAPPIPKLTPEQSLEIERKAEYKSEYYNGEMFAIEGAPLRHNTAGLELDRERQNSA